MADTYKKLRLAAVQAAPVFLDRDASVEKACRLIREAGENGADLIGFPEGFIPTHPGWFNFLPDVGDEALLMSRELFKNAVEVPGPSTDALCRACRDANIIAVVGINEKISGTTGTMYNTQLFISRSGQILGKHQKMVPTNGERLVHAGGQASTMRAFQTDFGAISGMLCGENSNPLATFALAVHYPVVHVASWPAHFNASYVMQESILVATRGLAYSLKSFVINSCAVVNDELIERYAATAKDRDYLMKAKERAGASIIGPKGQILAEMEPGEGIVYADVDTQDVIIPKLIHDFAGHYNRPDVFQVALTTEDHRLLINVADSRVRDSTPSNLEMAQSERPRLSHDDGLQAEEVPWIAHSNLS
ncbi:carbon-nitrogen hydrolase family protein [Pusillimonas caeni]|uniref:carbon-nitrogen hydrolase family protein n=1 Tax=Pusillimonas caeni TaxID=1348472 RepID=UPI001ADD7DD4|nr:carbon-nitrogen hydrolase family protein [Pusillimonas caeni]